jgi:PPOX class probable F420-dependent enzyme
MSISIETRPTSERGRGLVVATILLAGLLMVAAGGWALLAPDGFAEFVDFPASIHFVHDAGAFQLGIGATLLLALSWRDGPALALAGFLVGNSVHAVNHAVDLDLGGRGWQDPVGLAALSLLTTAALVVRLRQLGWVVGEVATATTPALAPFVRQKTILLTSYRRDGTPVGAPVSIAVDGGHAYIRSPGNGGKVRRMRNHPMVELAPCTTRGRTTGPPIGASARRLEGAEAAHAARLLARKHPFLHGLGVPLIHRAFRAKTGRTAHFELTPLAGPAPGRPGVDGSGRAARLP